MDLKANGLLFLFKRLLVMVRLVAEVHLDARVDEVRVVNHVALLKAPFMVA